MDGVTSSGSGSGKFEGNSGDGTNGKGSILFIKKVYVLFNEILFIEAEYYLTVIILSVRVNKVEN